MLGLLLFKPQLTRNVTLKVPKNYVKQLMKELRELQAQVEAIKTFISDKESLKENSEAKELAGLKNQVAELKAQLTAPETPQQWTGNTFTSKGSSAKFQNRQTKKDAKNQQRSSSVTSSSWILF